MPTLDIIVPVYNAKKLLPKCVRSIQRQTFSDWNLILVDDGSTDGSGEICDRLAAGDRRISVVHQENGGAVKARQTGVEKASSTFVAFVDADDLVEPAMFQRLLNVQEQYSADIVYCRNRFLSSRGYLKSKDRKCDNVTLACGREEAIRMASAFSGYELWGKLFRRELFLKAQNEIRTIPDVFWGEDCMLTSAIFSKADVVVMISDQLYDYRVGGLSHNITEKTFHDLSELYRWRKNFLLAENADMKYHKNSLAQLLNSGICYAHYSKKLLSREKICSELAYPIADIESICPNYRHKNAYDLSIPMTDEEFRAIYHESPLVVVKQILLRIF